MSKNQLEVKKKNILFNGSIDLPSIFSDNQHCRISVAVGTDKKVSFAIDFIPDRTQVRRNG